MDTKKFSMFYHIGSAREVVTVDYVVGLFGQISLTLLIIFIIATVIFSRNQKQMTEVMQEKVEIIEQTPKGEIYKELEKITEELKEQKLLVKKQDEKIEKLRNKTEELQEKEIKLIQAEKKVEDLQTELNEIKETTLAQKIEELGEARISLQRQQLIVAIERVNNRERANLRLNVFIHKNIAGTKTFEPQNPVSEGTINKQIIIASKYATRELPYREKMAERWLKTILPLAKIEERDLSGNNADFLRKEIHDKINILFTETIDLQCRVLSQLQDYFLDNPAVIEDVESRNLAKKWIATSDPEERDMLAKRIQAKIGDYTKKTLEDQEVHLLREALKSIKHTW